MLHALRSLPSRGLAACALTAALTGAAHAGDGDAPFRRVASMPVFLNTSADLETVAEIITTTRSGDLLIYTDAGTETIGFIELTDPENPTPRGFLQVGGEPTSVTTVGRFALVCVNTSESFTNPSGVLQVVDLNTRAIAATIDLGGQPDAIAANSRYAAIAIENERDEDLGSGEPPQLPAGFLLIVDLVGAPSEWTTRQVDLVGVPDLFPDDPEPEFVDINRVDEAVVTLQENNHIAIVDLASGTVVSDFSCGTVDLDGIDTNENDLIEQNASLKAVPREPDAVTWIGVNALATADEGDLFGGSRGFTIFDRNGSVLSTSGNSLDQLVAAIGHYPEGRSENKGNEPEGIEFGVYGGTPYLFVGSERSSVVFVYDLSDGVDDPEFVQVLPAGVGPEGLLAIPQRDLFVVACEEDNRGDKIRAVVSVYVRDGQGDYPTIVSDASTEDGAPIPWAALSGLAVDPNDDDTLFTVYDSFYRRSRIFTIDNEDVPARIVAETELNDSNGLLLAALAALKVQLPGTDDFDPAAIVDVDGGVNLDLEGVAVGPGGDFYVVSEGAGNLEAGVSDPEDRPFESPNLLLRVTASGDIVDAILPPFDVTLDQFRFGFEGVAVVGEPGAEVAYVAFQRNWAGTGDPAGFARIGRLDVDSGDWTFALYELATPTSPNGGWVGLSEIAPVPGDGIFALIERDNQGGPDATIKTTTLIDVNGVTFRPHDDPLGFDVLTKTLVRDHIAAGDFTSLGLSTLEKLEGLAVTSEGDVLIVNDNDGTDDNSGETRLLRFDGLLD